MARLVVGGVKLRKQIDARWPGRDRKSDGWIGDRAHSKRKSDHNPDRNGWVKALDIDENMGKKGKWRNGLTAKHLTDQLVMYAKSGLPGADRVKYVVYEGRLASGTYRSKWWKWRPGNWGHYQHIHISFTDAAIDDNRLWPLPILTKDKAAKKKRMKALKKG